MTAPFWQARSKLHWANQHLADLQDFWKRYLETDFCEFWVEDKPEWRPFEGAPPIKGKILKVRARPLPYNIPMAVGDVIHNIRTSLDYCINEIVHWQSERLGFPVHKERQQLADSFRTHTEVVGGKTKKPGGNADIARAVEGLAEFILDELKPYEGGDGWLWAITRLDNTDKHRMLTVMSAPHSVHDIVVTDDKRNRITIAQATVAPNGTMDVLGMGSPSAKVESHGAITAEIFFAESGIVEGQPIFPSLVNMLKRAAETIDSIQRFVVAKGWEPPAGGTYPVREG